MYIPDNYSIYEAYEAEQERLERRRRRREIEAELKFITVPDDYGTHKDCYPDKEGK